MKKHYPSDVDDVLSKYITILKDIKDKERAQQLVQEINHLQNSK